MKVLLCFLALVAGCMAGFEFKDCSGGKPGFRFETFKPTRHPVPVPGTFGVSFDADVTKTINGPLKVKLELQRKVTFFWVPIPCLFGYGSCTYDGICDWAAQWKAPSKCPPELANHNIPCTCPYPKGRISMNNQQFTVGALPTGLGWLADGTYWGKIKMLEQNGNEIGCVELTVEIDS
ncbi:ganglioside GM2 activator [Lingula anatina]|uniref:Ganglioside GM2 activator n=1 Tax=Lingula anatina TaxID=7574 RepID=A0A1S3IAU9_LINAN|nr:ganglioside GM2 activator [Lingula anatina]|eukprot:XP_013394534.1 ganglioside GM2 activator [Lingula anatina]